MIKKGDRVILKQDVSYSESLYAKKGARGTAHQDSSRYGNVFVCFDNKNYNIGKVLDGGLFICDHNLAVMFKQPDEFEKAIIKIKQVVRGSVKHARENLDRRYLNLQVETYRICRPAYVGRMNFKYKFGGKSNG